MIRTVPVNCPRCGYAVDAEVMESRVEYDHGSRGIEASITAFARHSCVAS